MPVKGIERVRVRIKATFKDIKGPRTREAVYTILSQGAGIAQTMTPIETSNLINSQTEPRLGDTPTGVNGIVGYTAEYASAVHSASGTLKGQERESGTGRYWDPDGEPEFLSKGFDEVKPAIPAILRRVYGSD